MEKQMITSGKGNRFTGAVYPKTRLIVLVSVKPVSAAPGLQVMEGAAGHITRYLDPITDWAFKHIFGKEVH